MSTFAPPPRNAGSNDRQSKGATPLLVHFDVNKTVIQSDSIQMKGIEDGIREGIAELFWGNKTQDANGKLIWVWTKSKPSCYPPIDESNGVSGRNPVNYFEFCRSVVKDKQDRKELVNTFKLVDDEARVVMHELLQVTLKKMALPQDIRFTKQAEESGLKGSTISMFPTLFHFVAALQRSKRILAILFRSFGADHETIRSEWNAFCEMKHPVYSNFLKGVGPLNGTVHGVPDRRIHSLHTMYRDDQGDALILNTFTNGPPERTWDSWAKGKPKPTFDDRNGRDYYRNVLKAEAVEGMQAIQGWMKSHIFNQGTAAIKDDWAWWQFHGERSHAGKLLTLIGGPDETEQLFFDDNIDISDTRIVDCRDVDGNIMPGEKSINRVCTKVNPVEALLQDEYFLQKLRQCHGEHLDLGASLIDFQRKLTEVEDQKTGFQKEVNVLRGQLKTLTDENRRLKLLHRINVRDEQHLRELLAKEFSDLEMFGKDGFRNISDLWWEIENGHCWLELDEHGKLVRSFEMVFLKLQYKMKNSAEDLILIETHEQGSNGRVQSRNYLPGVRKALCDTSLKPETSFNEVLARWVERGLGADLSSVVAQDGVAVFAPEAPNQQTGETQAYPIHSRINQSEVSFSLSQQAFMSHADLLQKIGLPGGKHFMVTDHDMHGGVVTRVFRWDKMATWEASRASASRLPQKSSDIDIAQVCNKLFRGHPHQEVYEKLLIYMFETFNAKKLCGGFSGSVVIRVQPFETDGQDSRPGEPCIVKLDRGEAIRDEYKNSVNVFRALPDRAARIIGDAAYAPNREGEEFGAMRLELAGACWNVPELAQANFLFTFKDLLLYESEQVMVGTAPVHGDMRPFGNVHSILAETFGPGGVVAALRKGGSNGLHRAMGRPLLWGWYTLKGKESKFNPYTAGPMYPAAPHMHAMYKQYFGTEMPNLKEIVVGTIRPMLEKLAAQVQEGNVVDLCPLIALAHGDLNAANIMIDALDAVWLIDFATSINLPLFTDMCKFEMACLFEYAVIPVTPTMLLNFGSTDKAAWSRNKIGDWLRVGQDIAELLMTELVNRGADRLKQITEEELNQIIEDVARSGNKAAHKQREIIRSLKARLCLDETEIACAYKYCQNISQTLLRGDYILDSLNLEEVPQIEPVGQKGEHGALCLKYFMDIAATVRRFMLQDITSELRDYSSVAEGCQAADALSLQMWLPILRESYRLIGYSDIPPQHKIWSIYHCNVVAGNVLGILATLNSQFEDLKGLQIMTQLQDDLENEAEKQESGGDLFLPRDGFTEAASHWIYFNNAAFQDRDKARAQVGDKIVHQVHCACPVYRTKPGFFAPILQVSGADGKPVKLMFAENIDAPQDLKLYLKEDFENLGINMSVDSEPLFDPAAKDGIGYVTLAPGTNRVETVTLKSRLHFMTIALLKLRLDDFQQDEPDVQDVFDITAWSGGMFTSSEDVSTDSRKAIRANAQKIGRQLGVTGTAIPADFKFKQLHALEAVVRGADGKELLGAKLSLGMPTLCYPPGAKLCIDTTVVQQHRSASPEVVVCKLTDSGTYRVCDAASPTEESARDFAPTCNNHVYLTPCNYSENQKLLVNKDRASWVDCEVVQVAEEKTSYRYRLLSSLPSQVDVSSDARMGLVSGQDVPQDKQAQTERVLIHVSMMNSGPALLLAAVYDDQVSSMKAYFRARHSFIIDGLSGKRLEIKSCAKPTLHLVHREKRTEQEGTTPRANSSIGMMSFAPANARRFANNRKASVIDSQTSSQPQEGRQGWEMLTEALERYEMAEASCSPNSFLLLGPPGSGKSCLICRLIMDCLERFQNIVPVLIKVSDLVKREDQNADVGEMDSADVSKWFDKYLKLTHGEGSLRYKMVRQAIMMHRALFLFQGLADGGSRWTPVIEHLIRDITLDRHFVVATTRPYGTSSLEGMEEHVHVMAFQHLTDEQQRWVAHAQLGLPGMTSLDQFMKQMRESQSVTGENEDAEQHENVFGNPMMLSMLLCYLDKKQSEQEDRDASGGKQEDEGVTITAVYRVAVDVMLNRVQSKQQADRHKKDEKVEQCRRILERMAMTMQLQNRTSIDATVFEKGVQSDLLATWQSLKEATVMGHAMFLRTSNEGDRMEMNFLVKGFLHYFAANAVIHAVIHDGSQNLPGLVQLLTDPSWASILKMLAEADAYKYVQLIEGQLESFVSEKGNNFLHLAAEARHRPVFQLLPMFQHAKCSQAALSMPNADKEVPLHLAAQLGDTNLCALMVKHKAPIDAEDARGALPMHVALQNRQFPAAKFLLDRYMEKKERSSKRSANQVAKEKEENRLEQLAAKMLNTEQPLPEDEFKTDLDEVFAELRFFGKDQKDQIAVKQSRGALLSVFWICCNRYENFVRPQTEPGKLTPESWQKMTKWTTETVQLTADPAKVAAMLVFVTIANLGKVEMLRKAFAPGVEDPTEALRSILQQSPDLMPSFARLEGRLQHMIISALKASDFNFGQFLQAENLPASLVTVKDILADEASEANTLGFFLFRLFASMCGVFGFKRLDGSLFMDDKNFCNFSLGLEVLQHLTEENEQQVYHRFLQRRAQIQGLNFNSRDQSSLAVVRLACMTRTFDEKGGQKIKAAFQALDPAARASLTGFLCADGINVKGFLPYFAPNLLEKGSLNEKVGLLAAIKMLLRVYQMAEKEYEDSDKFVITIYFDELAKLAEQCKDPEVFDFTKFEIVRTEGYKSDCTGKVVLSPWKLMREPARLDQLREDADNLVDLTMNQLVRENPFIKQLPQVLPEMDFFEKKNPEGQVAYAQTLGALLSAFWLASDHADAFSRSHTERRLTNKSWKIATNLVKHQADILNAIFVAVVVHGVCKIPKFAQQLAPNAKSHLDVIVHVMDTCPEVLPSYMRLSAPWKDFVRWCVTLPFNFEEWMYAEALPASLTSFKMSMRQLANRRIEGSVADQYLAGFFLFTFVELSGSYGPQSLEGSLYMTEDAFLKFNSAVDILKQLGEESANGMEQVVYDRLLDKRATPLGLDFMPEDVDSRATVRLTCWAEVADTGEISEWRTRVSVALQKDFSTEESGKLKAYLVADGLATRPGYVLSGAKAFFKSAHENPRIGLAAAIRTLLNIFEAAAEMFQGSRRPFFKVQLDRLSRALVDFACPEDVAFELQRISDEEAVVVPNLPEPEAPAAPEEPAPAPPPQANASAAPAAAPSPVTKVEKENGSVQDSDAKLRAVLEELASMKKSHEALRTEHDSLREVTGSLRDEHRVALSERDTARQESVRLQSVTEGFKGEAAKLRLESEARSRPVDTSNVALLKRDYDELLARTGSLRTSEDQQEKEAVELRNELNSAEAGLNGLNMEIDELTMELAKLRAQAASDARLQRSSSEARIELLELRRQLLGRETMLGHEREVADKRLDAARRETGLINERLELAMREKDWAMQELHVARRDERLAAVRNRTLADEGVAMRTRCDALEAAHRAMMWELETLRGHAPSSDGLAASQYMPPTVTSSASSMPAFSPAPGPRPASPLRTQVNARPSGGSTGMGSPLAPSRLEAPPPMAASAYAAAATGTASIGVDSIASLGTPKSAAMLRNMAVNSPSSSRNTPPLHRVSSRPSITQEPQGRLQSVRQNSTPFLERASSATSSQYAVGASSKSPGRAVVSGGMGSPVQARTPRTGSPVGSARADLPQRGSARVEHVQVVRPAPQLGDSTGSRSASGSQTVLRRMVPQHKSTGNLARYVDRGGGSPGPHLRPSLQPRQPPSVAAVLPDGLWS